MSLLPPKPTAGARLRHAEMRALLATAHPERARAEVYLGHLALTPSQQSCRGRGGHPSALNPPAHPASGVQGCGVRPSLAPSALGAQEGSLGEANRPSVPADAPDWLAGTMDRPRAVAHAAGHDGPTPGRQQFQEVMGLRVAERQADGGARRGWVYGMGAIVQRLEVSR